MQHLKIVTALKKISLEYVVVIKCVVKLCNTKQSNVILKNIRKTNKNRILSIKLRYIQI